MTIDTDTATIEELREAAEQAMAANNYDLADSFLAAAEYKHFERMLSITQLRISILLFTEEAEGAFRVVMTVTQRFPGEVWEELVGTFLLHNAKLFLESAQKYKTMIDQQDKFHRAAQIAFRAKELGADPEQVNDLITKIDQELQPASA